VCQLFATGDLVTAVKASIEKRPFERNNPKAKGLGNDANAQDTNDFNNWLIGFIVKMIVEQPSSIPVDSLSNEKKKLSIPKPNQANRATIESAADLIAFIEAVSSSSAKRTVSTRAENISLLEKRLRIASQKKQANQVPFEQQVGSPIGAEICHALLKFVDSVAKQKKAKNSQHPSFDKDELFRRRLVIRLAEYNSYLSCNNEIGRKIRQTLLNERRASAVIKSGPVTAAWSNRARIPLDEKAPERMHEMPEACLPRMDSGVKDQGPSSHVSYDVPWFKDPRH
jgi:hypothetical protein